MECTDFPPELYQTGVHDKHDIVTLLTTEQAKECVKKVLKITKLPSPTHVSNNPKNRRNSFGNNNSSTREYPTRLECGSSNGDMHYNLKILFDNAHSIDSADMFTRYKADNPTWVCINCNGKVCSYQLPLHYQLNH